MPVDIAIGLIAVFGLLCGLAMLRASAIADRDADGDQEADSSSDWEWPSRR